METIKIEYDIIYNNLYQELIYNYCNRKKKYDYDVDTNNKKIIVNINEYTLVTGLNLEIYVPPVYNKIIEKIDDKFVLINKCVSKEINTKLNIDPLFDYNNGIKIDEDYEVYFNFINYVEDTLIHIIYIKLPKIVKKILDIKNLVLNSEYNYSIKIFFN